MRKTKKNIMIKLLSVMVGVVFLITVGVTYSSVSYTMLMGSDATQTAVYASTQEVVVVNDTLENPISFGLTDTNHKVSVSYSVGYDFDLRVTYSLSWSNGESTDNVILNYANRDNFIVDENYVYVAKSITGGTGSITIFTGVDFIDSTDETYVGAYLTITATAEIYKTNSVPYDASHPLKNDSAKSSIAFEAWLVYRNTNLDSSAGISATDEYDLTSTSTGLGATGDAYVIVYNLRYSTTNGVTHPGLNSAYKKDTTSTGAYHWLGGNKYYSGIGVYIITGSSAVTLTARARASWNMTSQSTATAYDNNLYYNYSTGWTASGYETGDAVFQNYNYNYYIPANSIAYIPITDSIEITVAGMTKDADDETYSAYKAVSTLILNGESFSGAKISTGVISSSGASASSAYSSSSYSVINTTLYEAGLYDISSNSQQTFSGKLSITNNTSTDLTITISSYSIRYYVSNGIYTLYSGDTYGTSFTDSLWYRATATGSYVSSTPYTTVKVPAYSTVTFVTSYSVSASLYSAITTSYGSYDCWVALEPTISSANTTTVYGTETATSTAKTDTGVTPITSVEGGKLVVSLKNNTSYTLTSITVTISSITETQYSYSQVSSQPSDWAYSYWKYYVSTDGKTFTANTNSTYSSVSSNLYLRSIVSITASLSSTTTYNGATYADSKITASISLAPNETALVLTGTLTNQGTGCYEITSTAAASSYASTGVAIVNEGSSATANSGAYIINNSTTTAYYVRFAYSGSINQNNFYSVNGYVYYIGIVYAGEIVVLPTLTTSVQISLESIAVTDSYSSTQLSSWDSSAVEIFDEYFSHLSS